MDDAEAAAPPVERVGARVGVADGDHPEGGRAAVDDEATDAVAQLRHRVHLGDRLAHAGREPRADRLQRGGRGVEALRVRERPQRGVFVRRGEGDREGAVVALEHRELQVAEVAADRALASTGASPVRR